MMASHEDTIFDQNKYHFPGGAAKFREERTNQPWLEVLAQRDEQGTPGLQPVPNELKYASSHGSKRLYVDHSAPAFLSAPVQAAPASHFWDASIPAMAHTTTHDGDAAVEHNGLVPSQAYPWPQPETIDYPQHWSQLVATTEQQHHYTPPVCLEQQYHYAQPITDQPQWSQSTSTAAQSNHSEQTFWVPPVDQTGNIAPFAHGTGQHSYSSPEVSSNYFDGHASAWTHGTDGRPTLISSLEVPLIKEKLEPPPTSWSLIGSKNSRKREWWMLGGLLIAILVIVGSILGSKAAGRNTSNDVPSNDNTPVTPLRTIRQNSKLAVTGYRGDNGDYTLRLFFQDSGNRIRFMDKSSIGGTWTDPVTLDTLDYEPMPNGSISAGVKMSGDPQTFEFFYLDTTSTIRGQIFDFGNDRKNIKGTASIINAYPLQAAENSSISCYFPYIVSQDKDDGQIRWTKMLGQNGTQPWWTNDTSVNSRGSPQTDLVLLPVAQTYVNDGGFVYRAADGVLAVTMKDYTGNATAAASWNNGSLSNHIPAYSAIGAFVVGRPYTPEDVNTYILFQNEDGMIQVVWQDDHDWQGPRTLDMIGEAEMGSDIECLTQGAWSQVQISREQDMNRCFFQEKGTGRLREIWFDGNDWKDQGIVPLD